MSNSSKKILPSKEMCLSLANELIRHYRLSVPEVNSIDSIDAHLIVSLFEAITDTNVPDLLICEDEVEEAHNIQAVIDTLSLDVLGISLSHISGEAIVAGNLVAIYNLFQVLNEVMLHLSAASKSTKRKMKKNNLRTYKENLYPKKDRAMYSSFPESLYASSSKCESEKSKGKPAPNQSRKNSSKSSFKQSPFVSPDSTHEVHNEQESSTKRPLDAAKNSHKPLNIAQDISTEAVLEKPAMTEKSLSQSNQFESNQTDLPSYKPFVMKRKISKLSVPKIKTEYLVAEKDVEKLFEKNFETKVKAVMKANSLCKKRSQMRRNHLQVMKKPLKKPHVSPCRKSYLLPYSLRRRSVAHLPRQTHGQSLADSKKSFSMERPIAAMETKNSKGESTKGFVQELLHEFPGIQLSPALMNHVRAQYEQQLLKMHRQVKEQLFKKSKSGMKAEKAVKRQLMESDLLKKNLHHQQYFKEVQDRKKSENKIKYRLRDTRLKSVKMKQYCTEFQDEMKKKILKRNAAEELIFGQVFKEAMSIQRQHVDDLCQQAKEVSEKDAQMYLNYLISLENLYQDQFALLSEAIAGETKDAQIRWNAEKLELSKMQRDFQDVLKREIRCMQRTILQQIGDDHFRELDAERCIEEMRKQSRDW